MSRASRTLRQTLTIARRDFIATVFTPTFLLFLLAPLIMAAFGAVGGISAATLGKSAEEERRIYAILAPADAAAFAAADEAARKGYPKLEEPSPLVIVVPQGDPAAQARALISQKERDVPAILYGSLEAPQLIHRRLTSSSARYLALIADRVLKDRAAGPDAPVSSPRFTHLKSETPSAAVRSSASFFVVFVLFFLTLLLAGQTVGMLAEERNSKVIEVLAAAVPLEAVFFGKLVGMFGVALLFVGFWGTLITQGAQLLPGEIADGLGELAPAMGFVPFALIFLTYFSLAFLLLGAVFLGIGAQAATMREIQMLSLPITIFQVAMFGLSAAAASNPGSTLAMIAEIFPFSSPFAMAARAANAPEIWPHLLAIAWQAMWLAITISIGARAFRRGVLQSGSGKMKLSSLFGRS